MNRFEPWMADAIAPRATTGDPRLVTESLVRLGIALDRGTIVPASLLPWPNEPLRSAILTELWNRELAEVACGRPAACAVVLADIVDCVENTVRVRRRMLRGERQASVLSDDFNRWSITIDALWESLALRAVAVHADEAWRSLSAFRTREAAMLARLEALDRKSRHPVARSHAIVALDAPSMREASCNAFDQAISFDPPAPDGSTAPRSSSPTLQRRSAAPFDRSTAKVRARTRAHKVERWASGSLEPSDSTRAPGGARRRGAMFVCVERPEDADAHSVEAVTALVLIACAVGALRDRRVTLVTCADAPEELEVEPSTPLRSIVDRVELCNRSSAVDALRWVAHKSDGALRGADVLLATPKLWITSTRTEQELRPLHDRLRTHSACLRMLRPSEGALLPIGYDFDSVHSLGIDGVVPSANG